MKQFVPVRLVITQGELESAIRSGSCLSKAYVISGPLPVMDGYVELRVSPTSGGFEAVVDDGQPEDQKGYRKESWAQQRAREKREEFEREKAELAAQKEA